VFCSSDPKGELAKKIKIMKSNALSIIFKQKLLALLEPVHIQQVEQQSAQKCTPERPQALGTFSEKDVPGNVGSKVEDCSTILSPPSM
jgi:hypothetical protein